MDEERIAYLTLAQTPGMGPSRLETLLVAFGSALEAHRAAFERLVALPGFSTAMATAIKKTSLEAGYQISQSVARMGARVTTPRDPEYPDMLRNIPDPPPVLFGLGDYNLLSRPAAALVGSRDHSAYGAQVCRSLAAAAAGAGVVVVSGMARGLDAVAHTAALDAGGSTIGVLGNGLGVVYPAANRQLYDRVAGQGLLLTEFPPGERPHAGSFPRRNRLISGLSRVTVVIEAAVGSGALITAGTALDQGREVMVVPGNITSRVSVGANCLIRDGASPLLEPADLLHHYPELAPATTSSIVPDSSVRALPGTLSKQERDLAQLLGLEPVHPDQLAARVERPVSEVLALLCGLELAGVVEQAPGRMFKRV